jgi:regulator of sigma E protease
MAWLLNLIYYVVPFVVLLGILVFVHEFGHFLIARLCGVSVSAFSIGFGKELWGRVDKHGTRWKISTVPLGGYCQFLGDADASSTETQEEALQQLTAEEKAHAFAFQNPFKKLAIVLGGPGFNYLFAVLVYTALFVTLGKLTFPPVVGEVIADSAAEEAGLKAGDRILKIDGVEVSDFSEIVREISIAVQPNITLEVKRDNEILDYDVVLKTVDDADQKGSSPHYLLGVRSVSTVEEGHERVSLPQAVALAGKEVWDLTTTTLRGVGQMLTGKRGGEDIGGVIRIAEMSGDISKNSGILDFLVFMAVISVNLGLINLFPIPVLDGGHVVFFVLEILSRRQLSEKVKMFLFKIGFSLLVALMIFATWNDIVHLINRLFD